MNKITPDMLGSEVESIAMSQYDWEKQSRNDAFGTSAFTNSGHWTNSVNSFGQSYSSYDASTDSISD